MTAFLHRLGAWSYRRRRLVLTAWLALLVAAGVLAGSVGGTFRDDFTIPGSRAQQTLDTVRAHFPGDTAQLVYVAPEGRRIADFRTVAEPPVVSPDGRVALAYVPVPEAAVRAESARAAGLRVEIGGSAYEEPDAGRAAEAAGLLIALIVLVLTFGSLVTAGLPLLTALLGVGATVTGLTAVAGGLTVPTTAPALALMLGLAVGIDYALFIVARHRAQLASGLPVAESVARASATAGSAVVLAGLTVVIALAGLAVVRIPFLAVMGLAAAGAVIVAVLVAVTLIPALLGLLGERLRPRPGSRAARLAAPSDAGGGGGGAGEGGDGVARGSTLSARWVRLVTRRPLVTTVAVVAALGVMALPAAGLRLALTDNGSAPASSTQRQAYDLTARAFGPGFNGPLLVLAKDDGPSPAEAGGPPQGPSPAEAGGPGSAAAALAERLRAVDGVVAVAPPETAGGFALLRVIPATGPQDERTGQLVRDLEAAGGPSVAVTGVTAIALDISALVRAAFVPFAVVVVGLALLLLAVAFRSVVVPLKATLGFLLSVGATLGAVVAVFQWGWLADLIGVERTGPVVSFLPVILVAVLFGLAMDYEVFLVSGMREEYARSGDPRRAVHGGFRASARVVTAAALIMIAVFASFVPGGDATLKPIAFALAIGVLLDAFLVRMTLVPAVLTLAGHRAWRWW